MISCHGIQIQERIPTVILHAQVSAVISGPTLALVMSFLSFGPLCLVFFGVHGIVNMSGEAADQEHSMKLLCEPRAVRQRMEMYHLQGEGTA